MSLDYTDTWVARGTSTSLASAGTTTQVWGYLFSKSYTYKVLHAVIRVRVAASNATGNTFKVQLSASDGTFTSGTTDLVSFDIAATAAAGMLEQRVSDALTDVTANGTRCVRIIHVPGANDANLSYDWEVTCGPVGY